MHVTSTLYEVRVFENSSASSQFANNLVGLLKLVKSIQGKKYKVYQVYKSSTGGVLSSEELSCSLRGNSLVLKTIKTNPFVPKPKKPKPPIKYVKIPDLPDPGAKRNIPQVKDNELRIKEKQPRDGLLRSEKSNNTPLPTMRPTKTSDVSIPSLKRAPTSPSLKRAPSSTVKVIGRSSKQKSSSTSRPVRTRVTGNSRNSKSRRKV